MQMFLNPWGGLWLRLLSGLLSSWTHKMHFIEQRWSPLSNDVRLRTAYLMCGSVVLVFSRHYFAYLMTTASSWTFDPTGSIPSTLLYTFSRLRHQVWPLGSCNSSDPSGDPSRIHANVVRVNFILAVFYGRHNTLRDFHINNNKSYFYLPFCISFHASPVKEKRLYPNYLKLLCLTSFRASDIWGVLVSSAHKHLNAIALERLSLTLLATLTISSKNCLLSPHPINQDLFYLAVL